MKQFSILVRKSTHCYMLGQTDYDRLRPLSYPGTDVALICFSVVDPDSFETVGTKWLGEMRHHCTDVPWFIIGLQTDLRDEKNTLEQLARNKQSPITPEKVTAAHPSFTYLECSSLDGKGVQKILNEAVEAALPPLVQANTKASRRGCVLL